MPSQVDFFLRKNKYLKILFLTLFTIVIFQLSVKYKIDNTPAVRPLFFTGVLSLAVFLLLSGFLYNKKKIQLNLRFELIGLFLTLYLYAFLSSLYVGSERESKDILYALFFDFGYMILLVIWMKILCASSEPEKFIELLMKFFVWFGFVATIVALLVFFRLIHFEFGDYQLTQSLYAPTRIHGFMGDPSHYGGLAAIGLISLHLLVQKSAIKSVVLIYFLYLVYFLGLLMSGSRASWLGLFICMMIYMLVNSRKFLKYSIRLLVIVMPVLAIIFVMFSDEILDMLTLYFERTFRLIGVSGKDDRLVIWAGVVGIFADVPLLNMIVGSGSGFIESFGGSTFNVLLRVTANYGFIFSLLLLLLYIIVFLRLILSIKVNYQLYFFPCLMLIFYFVYSQFIDVYMNKTFHFVNMMFVFAILISSLRMGQKKNKNLICMRRKIEDAGVVK